MLGEGGIVSGHSHWGWQVARAGVWPLYSSPGLRLHGVLAALVPHLLHSAVLRPRAVPGLRPHRPRPRGQAPAGAGPEAGCRARRGAGLRGRSGPARGCGDGAWRVLRQCAARPGGGWWQLLLPWKKCTSYVWKKWLALKYFLLVFGSKIFYNTRQSWLTDVLGTCVRQTLLYIKFSPNMMPMRHNLHHSAVSE